MARLSHERKPPSNWSTYGTSTSTSEVRIPEATVAVINQIAAQETAQKRVGHFWGFQADLFG